MKKIVAIVLMIMFTLPGLKAQMPGPYAHVDQMVWVVKDLNEVVRGWKQLGFNSFYNVGYVDALQGSISLARFGEADIVFIQPGSNNKPLAAFLEKNGDGVFSLAHRFANYNELKDEVERLKSKGIGVLNQGSIDTGEGMIYYAFMDTMGKGKYVLGLVAGFDPHQELNAQAPYGGKFTQYAFAVENPEPVSKFWAKVGLPVMDITHPGLKESRYYGKPADFDMNLGWQRHGDVTYEWCIPLKGPTVYHDHIKKHGEGVQHIGINVPDIDQVIKKWEDLGYKVAQSGAWGEKGKPGSGRYAYIDTDEIGGLMVELLWNYKAVN